MNATEFSPPDLQLDPRQRAMLEEMGIKAWWPATDATVVPGEAVSAKVAPNAEAANPPTPGGQSAAAPLYAAPGEPPLRRVAEPQSPVAARASAPPVASQPTAGAAAHASIGADTLIDAPRHLFGAANARGGWLIVADMPPDLHGRHGEPLDGDEGRLLANMLRALRLDTGELPVHLMRTHRGEPLPGDDAPQPVAPALAQQLDTLAPRMVLAMGPLAAQFLLHQRAPIGKLRGPATPLAQQPGALVVATYHPAYLLRNGADKGRAWVDLCSAAAAMAAIPAT